MKRKNYFLTLLLLFTVVFTGYGQEISLNEMEMLCKKSSWVDVNNYLLAKGWSFYSSSKPLDDGSKKLVWAYNYNSIFDEASAWLYLYIEARDESKLSAIAISFAGEQKYNKFINAIAKNGYKRTSSSIENEYSRIKYKGANYSITLTIEQGKNASGKVATYDVFLLKNNTLLDNENGKKIHTFEGGAYLEYNMKDGALEGPCKLFYGNGKLWASMNYANNKLTGEAKCYDEEGRIRIDAFILDTNLNCNFTRYEYDEQGVITKKIVGQATCHTMLYRPEIVYTKESKYTVYHYEVGTLDFYAAMYGNYDFSGGKVYDNKNRLLKVYTSRNDTLVGEYKFYSYKDTDKPYSEEICFYKDGKIDGKATRTIHLSETVYEVYNYVYNNGELNGLQQSFLFKDGESFEFEHYYMQNGNKIGQYVSVYKDSVFIGSRNQSGKINGLWRCFIDERHIQDSTVRTIDTTQLMLLEQGNFINGGKNGNWYYKSWKDECLNCDVKEYIFENDEWKSAKIEFGDSMCYYYRVNSRIYVVEYKNGRMVRKTGYWVPANSKFPELKNGRIKELFNLREKDGDYEEYDMEERIVVKGKYKSSQKWGDWLYYYYDQKCVMTKNVSTSSESFMNIDKEEPFSGKVTISDGDYIYVISVKKGLRNGTTKIYEKDNDKVYAKEKYKDGLKEE